jgi:polyamine oxidase
MLRHVCAGSLKFLLGLFSFWALGLPQAMAAEQFDVVIVGAGMSGVAAGKKLKENGFSVVLLEARDYAGGRMRTITLEGTPVDLGAAFIEGTKDNPILDLVNQFKLPFTKFDWDDNRIFNTFEAPYKEVTSAEYDLIAKLQDELYDKIDELQDSDVGNEVSLAKGLAPWIASFAPKTQLFLNFVIGAEIENDYAADTSNLSLNYFNQDQGRSGGDAIMVKGYNGVITSMIENAKLDVRLGHVVSSISYNATGGTVVSNKGTFQGKWVICTVPLGILKLPKGTPNRIEFDPPLPAEKLAAIDRLEMGILDRTVLVFPQKWLETLAKEDTIISRVPPYCTTRSMDVHDESNFLRERPYLGWI